MVIRSADQIIRAALDSLPAERIYVNVNNIHTEGRTSMQLVATLDEYGKPAWFIATIAGFLIWWPIGLGVLTYLIWSGRMGCGNKTQWKDYLTSEARRFGGGMTAFGSTGNRAFDDYREETLRRLEDEAKEFQGFLQRLRHAKDKAEFDQFMAERRSGGAIS
jgi:hypothetical protein